MQDRLARMEALLMQHLGIRPHVPPTPRTPPSPVTERSGPQSDDQPGHLTTDIAPSQSADLDDHQPRHWTDPHRRMPEDRHHLLDDHDEFMYVQRWHLLLVLLIEKELTRLLYFYWIGGTIITEDMDRNLLVTTGANGELCTHGTAMVTSISNPNELDHSDVFFNPLPLFLIPLFLVNANVASTQIFAGTTIENIFARIGIIGAIGSLGARSTMVVVADTFGISIAENTVVVGSVGTIGETKCARTTPKSTVNCCP
ncbi:hypothetical protein Scep_022111 [Stephania cephalantha]|uniref:Uncharacterized protein n=1 Tax=Stephania cephalantha TaxID=152367 RepID=A0AAP0I0Q8_9MAGN